MTIKALSFLDNPDNISRAIDLGCGTGGQTMVLTQNITGSIIGIDQFPEFIDALNDNAEKLNLDGRVKGMVGDMTNLSFEKEEFDLIWSEGSIDGIGFEKGLRYWNGFLKKNGYVVVSCPSWLADEHPAFINILLIIYTFFLAYAIIGKGFLTKSKKEKYLMTPLSIIGFISSGVVSIHHW